MAKANDFICLICGNSLKADKKGDFQCPLCGMNYRSRFLKNKSMPTFIRYMNLIAEKQFNIVLTLLRSFSDKDLKAYALWNSFICENNISFSHGDILSATAKPRVSSPVESEIFNEFTVYAKKKEPDAFNAVEKIRSLIDSLFVSHEIVEESHEVKEEDTITLFNTIGNSGSGVVLENDTSEGAVELDKNQTNLIEEVEEVEVEEEMEEIVDDNINDVVDVSSIDEDENEAIDNESSVDDEIDAAVIDNTTADLDIDDFDLDDIIYDDDTLAEDSEEEVPIESENNVTNDSLNEDAEIQEDNVDNTDDTNGAELKGDVIEEPLEDIIEVDGFEVVDDNDNDVVLDANAFTEEKNDEEDVVEEEIEEISEDIVEGLSIDDVLDEDNDVEQKELDNSSSEVDVSTSNIEDVDIGINVDGVDNNLSESINEDLSNTIDSGELIEKEATLNTLIDEDIDINVTHESVAETFNDLQEEEEVDIDIPNSDSQEDDIDVQVNETDNESLNVADEACDLDIDIDTQNTVNIEDTDIVEVEAAEIDVQDENTVEDVEQSAAEDNVSVDVSATGDPLYEIKELLKGDSYSIKQGLAMLKELIQEGNNPEAVYEYAKCWESGIGLIKNPRTALSNYRKALAMGLEQAQADIERLEAEQQPKEPKEKKEKQKNDSPIILNALSKGIRAYNERDYANAYIFFKSACKAKDVQAYFYYAICCEYGLGCEKNPEEAFTYYKLAVSKGNTEAIYYLAQCYAKGIGTEVNPSLAYKYYKKAADNGSDVAICGVGWCYRNGIGVEKNLKTAFKWYKRAADNGYAEAMYYVGWCYASGNGTNKDFNNAFIWFTKSAQTGDANAIYNLALCYEMGYGTEPDAEEAIKLYKKAAKKGSSLAKQRLKKIGR